MRDACTAGILTVIMVLAEQAEAYPAQLSDRIAFAGHQPRMPAAALLLVAAAGVVLAWRARYPRLVLCCSAAAVIAFALQGYATGAALLLPAVALGTLSRLSPAPRAALWAVGVTGVTMAAAAVNNPFGRYGGGWILIPADYAVALLAGIALANRRAYVDSVRDQAARQAAQESQFRVEEERLRIARELHDVVAHTMATITVQAAAATQLLRDRPDEAAESLKAIRAAGILMDIRMPGTDGLAATRRIVADDALSATKVVILTTFETDEYVYQALRVGASGFLVKDAEPEELIRAVRAVRVAHRGEALLSPSVTRRLIASLASRVPAVPSPAAPAGKAASDLARLTEREREVLALVAQGLSNEEIAGRLYLSPLTTKTHVSHIMTKLAARDRAQLVVTAYESGLVVPGRTA